MATGRHSDRLGRIQNADSCRANVQMKTAITIIVVGLLTVSLRAQWLDHPTAGIPRLPNGKANLAAPTPRKPSGQPDLSGIWQVPGLKYLINIAADLKEVPFQPWAEEVYK